MRNTNLFTNRDRIYPGYILVEATSTMSEPYDSFSIIKFLRKKFKRILFMLIVVAFFSSFKSSTNGTMFKEWAWNSIREGGAMYHRPIMVFVYGTTCNLSKNTMAEFQISRVGDFYNKTYICFKMNADKTKDFLKANQLGVKSIPTCVYLTEKSKIVHSVPGYQNRSQLLENGQLAYNKIVDFEKKEKKDKLEKQNEKNQSTAKKGELAKK